jgi:peroxiredoxin
MEFQNKFKNDGLSVIGVSMDDDGWKSVKPFLGKQPINYPIVVGNERLAKLYGVESMPMTPFTDRDGKIADSFWSCPGARSAATIGLGRVPILASSATRSGRIGFGSPQSWH